MAEDYLSRARANLYIFNDGSTVDSAYSPEATGHTAEVFGRLSFEHRPSASREYLARQRGRPLYAECQPVVSRRSASRELTKPGGRQSPRLEASLQQPQHATTWTAARCRAQAQRRPLPKRVNSYDQTRCTPSSLNTCSVVEHECDADQTSEIKSLDEELHIMSTEAAYDRTAEPIDITGFLHHSHGEWRKDIVRTGEDVDTITGMAGDAAAGQNTWKWPATPEPDYVPLKMARNDKVPRDCIATGSLKGTRTEAFADSGANNLISDAYLRMQGLVYKTGKRRDIRVGNGRKAFSTLGTIRLPWKFQNEEHTEYYIDFEVIPAHFCSYAVTLGGESLLATRTLAERFKDRILRKPRQSIRPRLFYHGASHVRMRGYCGGMQVAALADTGSDLDLLSPEMLAELGYDQRDILTDDEHRVLVELPGGLTTRTMGMVRDLEFRFGESRSNNSYLRDFYILPGLPAGVLIGEDLLWESDAFSKYSDDFVVFANEGFAEDMPDGMFLNIKLVQQARSIFARFNK